MRTITRAMDCAVKSLRAGRPALVAVLVGLSLLVAAGDTHAGTVALWLFDDPPGSDVAVDSSGNGYHLLIGQDAAIVPGGRFGSALDADALEEDGLGAYRYKAEPPLNPGCSDWTLECWVKARPHMSGDNRIWGLSGVNYIDYGRGDKSATLQVASRFLPVDGPGGWDRPTINLNDDERYHHVAVVYDAQARQLRHYADGRLQFVAEGIWKAVETGDGPEADVVFPPHYPMLQIGMRDAIQQWDHRELHADTRLMKKFQGYIDEMRFSDEALYSADFTSPESLARPRLRVRPDRLSVVAIRDDSLTGEASITVSAGQFALDWSAEADVPWLSVAEARGNADADARSILVSVDASGLRDGAHVGRLSFRCPEADNGRVEVPVLLTVIGRSAIRRVGTRKQLFIDERFIGDRENVVLRMNRPRKIAIEFEAVDDMPLYPCSVLFDDQAQVFRMYYSAFARSVLCYAESDDGIHWARPGGDAPPLGVATGEEGPGSVAPLPFGTTVMRDPGDVPERRYKAFVERRTDDGTGNGVYAYCSADGLRFNEHGRVMSILPETGAYAYWDPRIGRYAVYMRVMNVHGGLKMIQGNQFVYRPGFTYEDPEGLLDVMAPETMGVPGYENVRAIGRLEMDSLLEPWPVLENAPSSAYTTFDHVPLVTSADAWDGFADFYTGLVCIYPYAEDVYLMFPTVFRHFHPSRQPWFHEFSDANGPIEIQLAVSRDGIHWTRPERAAYVETGLTDEWDRWLMMMGRGMVRRGHYLYQYYWSSSRLHDSIYLRPELESMEQPDRPGLGAVVQRLDGFVSADADHRGGHITTPPIVFDGDRLEVNHDCGATGTVFVELRDLNDQPIRGFSLADCEEITGNDVGWEVRWRGKGDVSSLAGRPVKLHFKMAAARLYAFQFVHAQE